MTKKNYNFFFVQNFISLHKFHFHGCYEEMYKHKKFFKFEHQNSDHDCMTEVQNVSENKAQDFKVGLDSSSMPRQHRPFSTEKTRNHV